MAKSTLCVSCAQLPTKDRSLAVNKMRCPECRSEFGVTSYGSSFRILPVRNRVFSPFFMAGVAVGAGLVTFVLVLVGMGIWSTEIVQPTPRVNKPSLPQELAMVREVGVDKPIDQSTNPAIAKQRIGELVQKIKRENSMGANKDAFVLAQMERRPELRGLPFVMGAECRLDMNRAQSFETSVQAAREGMEADMRRSDDPDHGNFWTTYSARSAGNGVETASGVAALTQILGPGQGPIRLTLVKKLANSRQPEATRALARAVLFDTSADVRIAALNELKNRKNDAVQDEVLFHGITYPMPMVAVRAANAIAELERKDLAPKLADFLDQPAPGDPQKKTVGDKEVCEVREVVKINHHRNCLLCHPPSATGQPHEVPGVIPIPGVAFPTSPKDAYGSAQSLGDPMVRADTTYLRQDFSMMLPVENAAPWPDLQRFDFLVRSRVVEGSELQALLKTVQDRPAGFVSANHKAATDALRRLTGQEAAANRAAWHRVLGINAQD